MLTDGVGWEISRPCCFPKHATRNATMDSQFLILDLGWVFFAAWGMVLIALSAIAFGRDLLSFDGTRQTKVH